MSLSTLALRVATQRRVVSFVQRVVRGGALSHGPKNARAIALTFDDGPHAVWTPRVLDALDEVSARGTFFVVGRNVAAHPELVRETRRRGHEIGTHLYSHERSVVNDDAAFATELRASIAQLEDVLGERVHWLRFPYGERGRQRPDALWKAFGVKAAHWTFSGHDGFEPAGRIVERVTAGLRQGAIVLLHDCLSDEGRGLGPPYVASREATCLALPGIAAAARARGLAMVTLSDIVDRPKPPSR